MSVVDNIKSNLANRNNYGNSRSLKKIKYIVIHYTANDGDSDENNAKYFKNNVVKTSAHYFVDNDSITQSVPDNYVAYHCGAKSYKHKECRNTNSIGIELCDNIRNRVVYPTDKTIQNALELVEYLCKKYSIPKENVIRHYDVTGKKCPAYWVDNSKWKSEFWNKIGVRPKCPYLVKINTSTLNVRAGAGTNFKINTTVKQGGIYTIVEEKDGWGKLKSGVGWVKLSYTIRV